MRPTKSIICLAAVVSGIVIFWLTPNLNKAGDTYYTRIYEDTDVKPGRAEASMQKVNVRRAEARDTTARRSKKAYKKERIHSSDKLSAISPSKFSRAIHFTEEVIVKDSVSQGETIVARDTAEELFMTKAVVKYLIGKNQPDSLSQHQ
jgi:hypothetical protein